MKVINFYFSIMIIFLCSTLSFDTYGQVHQEELRETHETEAHHDEESTKSCDFSNTRQEDDIYLTYYKLCSKVKPPIIWSETGWPLLPISQDVLKSSFIEAFRCDRYFSKSTELNNLFDHPGYQRALNECFAGDENSKFAFSTAVAMTDIAGKSASIALWAAEFASIFKATGWVFSKITILIHQHTHKAIVKSWDWSMTTLNWVLGLGLFAGLGLEVEKAWSQAEALKCPKDPLHENLMAMTEGLAASMQEQINQSRRLLMQAPWRPELIGASIETQQDAPLLINDSSDEALYAERFEHLQMILQQRIQQLKASHQKLQQRLIKARSTRCYNK